MMLSTDIMLLASPTHGIEQNEYANQLLCSFVQLSAKLYGPGFLVYNVHCLIHLATDVKRFGCLDAFSAFPFENHLKMLKHLLRRASFLLPQIIRRIVEKQRFLMSKINGNIQAFLYGKNMQMDQVKMGLRLQGNFHN